MISHNELKQLTSFARTVARDAGKILLKKSRRRHHIILKGRVDLVTDADLASEKFIVNAISKKFPEHSILAEEEAARDNHSDFRWVIDPLDGTTNFAHDFPFYCVSIGLEYKSQIVAGVVYDPERDEMFYAFQGGGAFLNRKEIHVANQSKLENALLATGFPYDIGSSREDNLIYFRRFAKKARGLRRAGSAALDLCYLACGRFDGFWELKLHPWDTAAAKIIVEEAGGIVTDFEGKKYSIYGKFILAGNRKIHSLMKKVLAE
ncbi:MAG: inositol monophosphatase family protein [Candidatus Zixiibacteriota bacterium]